MFADFYRIPIAVGNAVVMQEDTRVEADRVEITEGVKPFEHIRLRGEDVKEGEPIGRAGEVMHAGRLQLLGAAGVARVEVYRRPIVGCWPRGMNCANRVRLWARAAFMRATGWRWPNSFERPGAEARVYPLVNDTLDATKAALRQAFDECDAVVTSGGVSVGDHDFVKPALEALGGELDFWKVRIKPGKPFVYGRLRGKPLLACRAIR